MALKANDKLFNCSNFSFLGENKKNVQNAKVSPKIKKHKANPVRTEISKGKK